MSLHYIIDGYNLLYALSEIPSGSWQQKREALLSRMVEIRPQGNNRLTVVFDSREGLGDRGRHGDMDIIYTAGETADDWISEKVRSVVNPRILVVVTDDQGLRRMVRGTGAKWISTKDFWKPVAGKAKNGAKSREQIPFENEINEELRKKWL